MIRRRFLGALAGGFVAGANNCRASADRVKPGDIPMRPFGKTGVKLTIIGMARGRLPLVSDEEAQAVVLRAYELGVNYFDNARAYWDWYSGEVYGKVLPPFRKEIFLTTKSLSAQGKGCGSGTASFAQSTSD